MALGGLIRPELARAFENYFVIRGGEQPQVASEVVPVVIMDDNSKGPYAPYRTWHAGTNLGAFVGNLSYCAIANVDDPAKQKSVVVIEEIYVNVPAGGRVLHGLTTQTQPSIAYASVNDADGGKEYSGPTNDPRLGNVAFGSGQSPSFYASAIFPASPAAAIVRIPGPFAVGPGWQYVVVPNLVNTAIEAWFRGRFYPSF